MLCIAASIGLLGILGYSAFDLKHHWRLCAYTLNGVDPFPLIGEKGTIEAIGSIREGFSTSPWGLFLGNLFYPGWMPMQYAGIYNFALHFVVLLLTEAVIWLKFRGIISKNMRAALMLLPLGHFSFVYSLRFGNCGAILCYLLIIAVCIYKEHPYMAAVCVGLAMIKPQIAVPVCVVFLLEKQWAVLFAGAAIDVIGWGAASFLTGVSPLKLLGEMFQYGTVSSKQFLGVLSVLRYTGISESVIMVINAGIGLGLTVGLWLYLKQKNLQGSPWIRFMPSCIASTIWCYKNGTDFAVLALCSAFAFFLCIREDTTWREWILSLFCLGFLQMGRAVTSAGVSVALALNMGRDTFKSMESLLLILIAVYICISWVKIYERGEESK